MGRTKGGKTEALITKARHETIVPRWKEAAVNTNTPVWQSRRKGLEKKRGRQEGGERRSRRGERQTGPAKAAPMTSSATLLNLSAGVTGRCSAFSMMMTDLLKQRAASRSFEQLLTSKLSRGFTPSLVPTRHTQKGLDAPSFLMQP